jgi:hypothetical protein
VISWATQAPQRVSNRPTIASSPFPGKSPIQKIPANPIAPRLIAKRGSAGATGTTPPTGERYRYTSCSGRLQGTEILRIAEAVLPPGTGFLPPETELTTGPPRDIVSLSRTRRRSTQQHSGRQVSRIVDSPVRACSSYFCRQIAPLWAFEAQIGRAGFSSTRETPFNSGLYQYWCRMMDLVEIDLATNAARMFWTRWI